MVDCIDKKIARPPLYGSPGKPKYLPWLRHHFDDYIDGVIWIQMTDLPPLARFCHPHRPSLPPARFRQHHRIAPVPVTQRVVSTLEHWSEPVDLMVGTS